MSYLVTSYLLFAASVILASSLMAAEPLPLSKDYWKDEAFLKSFNGSYRVNARIEPTVTTEERGLLVSIQPMMAAGKREEALAKLTSSELIKSSAAIAFNAGNIQFELQNLEDAEKHYTEALNILPSFRRAHRNLGFVFARQENWEKALPALEQAIGLGDQDAATLGQFAYGRMHQEQYVSALQAFRLARLTQPDVIEWKAGAAQCLGHLKRDEEALALLEEVIKARPNDTSYYLLQASLFISLDRQDDAIANLDLVRRLGQLDTENHLLLANLHLRAGSSQLARPVMMEALAMEKKAPFTAVINVLEFTTMTRDWVLARDFAQGIEKAYPDMSNDKLEHKQTYLSAIIDIDSGENPARGAEALEQLIDQDPLDGLSLILLARYRAGEQRYQEAGMLLEQAGRVEGHEYQSRVELAKIFVATKRYTNAVDELDQALEIRPGKAIRDYRDAVVQLAAAAE